MSAIVAAAIIGQAGAIARSELKELGYTNKEKIFSSNHLASAEGCQDQDGKYFSDDVSWIYKLLIYRTLMN